jgi:hypothetical protein
MLVEAASDADKLSAVDQARQVVTRDTGFLGLFGANNAFLVGKGEEGVCFRRWHAESSVQLGGQRGAAKQQAVRDTLHAPVFHRLQATHEV